MTNDSRQGLAAFTDQRLGLLAELRENPSGLEWSERYTTLVDQLIRSLYAELAVELVDQPPVTVVATGGYGRRELSPWSDIDLTLLPVDEAHPLVERAIKSLFMSLQETVARGTGTKIGYALRYPSDAPGLDGKTRSGLLDARVVVGPPNPYTVLTNALWSHFPVADFLIEKIAEMKVNWSRTNDSPLVVQPDLKVGAGGLRSFQTANWIRAALGERMERPSCAYERVLACRNVLHLVSDRMTDKLSHERRSQIADIYRTDPLEFGSQLANDLSTLHETYLSAVRRVHDSRFSLAPHVEAVRGEARIGALATAGNAAVGISHATSLGLVIPDTKAKPVPVASAGEAMLAFINGELTVRNLERAGVLDVLLPELTVCKTKMPQDGTHDFTVFEHTMRVLRKLDCASKHLFFGPIEHEVRDKGPLYLAALLHDVGRIESEEDHAETGARLAEQVCDRLGIYTSNKETVCWLVREHLTFDRTLRLRDLTDPRTAIDFATLVGTQERLAMLALLTWADVSAVSDHTWTLTHETMAQDLFYRTLAVLSSDSPPLADGATHRKRLLKRSKGSSVPSKEFEDFLDSMPGHYLLATEPETALSHFDLIQSARAGEPAVLFREVKELGATEVTVSVTDSIGLLSKILGVLYANDLSISAIRAATTKGELPVALDTIIVTYGGKPVTRSLLSRVASDIKSVLAGERTVGDVITASKKDSERRQQFLTVKYVAGTPGIVEVQAPRGRGLAYRLSRQLADEGIEIVGARVSQWAGQGAAAIYVVRQDGSPIDEAVITRALSGH